MPLNIDWQQILLHLFNFLILSTGLYFLLHKPIQNFMKKRMEYYEEQEKQANWQKEEAEKLKKEYDQLLDDAVHEINQMKTEEMKKATKDTQLLLEEAKSQADKIISDAEKEAYARKKKLTKIAQQDVAKMVISAAEKLLIQNNGFENDSEIYDRFLASAKEADHGEQG